MQKFIEAKIFLVSDERGGFQFLFGWTTSTWSDFEMTVKTWIKRDIDRIFDKADAPTSMPG